VIFKQKQNLNKNQPFIYICLDITISGFTLTKKQVSNWKS